MGMMIMYCNHKGSHDLNFLSLFFPSHDDQDDSHGSFFGYVVILLNILFILYPGRMYAFIHIIR